MSKICFVSYEIAPTTKGGAGALIANIARVLIQQGHEIILLLDLPRSEYERFQWLDRLDFDRYESITTYHVEEISQDITYKRENFNTEFEWRSYRFFWVLQKLVQLECPDIIEFFDYSGVGYYSLKSKIAGEAFLESWLTIRVHTTIEAIDRYDPTDYSLEKHIVYGLERYTFQIAERILLPSKSIYEHLILPMYNEKWFGEIGYSPPPLLIFPKYQPNKDANAILFYGRLDQLKGADTFLDAAVVLLNQLKSPRPRFILAGGELNLAPIGYASFEDYLKKRIPLNLQEYFEFRGVLTRKDLESLLPQIQFAVFPNRLESYGYAAHELYAAGVPLIINDIPAFFDILSTDNATFFNGSKTDLAHKMEILNADKSLRQRLGKSVNNPANNTVDSYNPSDTKTWIDCPDRSIGDLSIKIFILYEQNNDAQLNFTLDKFRKKCDIIILSTEPYTESNPEQLLGQLYYPHNYSGDESANSLVTGECALFLRAGDDINIRFIEKAIEILTRHAEIGLVSSWRVIRKGHEQVLDTFPIDATVELLPFRDNFFPTRMVMRTEPGLNIADLFDSRMQQLGEIGYIWQLVQHYGPGVMLPEPFLQIIDDQGALVWDAKTLNFLLLNADVAFQKRLAPFLLSRYTDPGRKSYLEWAELDLRLLLKNLARPPLGNLLSLNHNFSKLFKRYLS